MDGEGYTRGQNGRDPLVEGQVTEALPSTLFRVVFQTAKSALEGEDSGNQEILAYLSGSMRLHRIRVLVGDRVLLKLDPYGGKGRITKRL